MTPKQLEQIKARVEVATPGPWEQRLRIYGGGESSCEIVGNIGPGYATPVCKLSTGFYRYEGDKNFITHARQDIPALVAEVERLHELYYACIKFGEQLPIEVFEAMMRVSE